MLTAMEYNPESFGLVIMLYIDCWANHAPIKAFVDSGAQMTFMSVACATRCNVMLGRNGQGVGMQKIIGRVHLCQIQIGDAFLHHRHQEEAHAWPDGFQMLLQHSYGTASTGGGGGSSGKGGHAQDSFMQHYDLEGHRCVVQSRHTHPHPHSPLF